MFVTLNTVTLKAKSRHLRELASGVDDLETQAQFGPGLNKLQWFHLKFLLAREHLQIHTPSHLQLDLAERMVDSSDLFGSSLPLVSDLDAHFQGRMDRDTLR